MNARRLSDVISKEETGHKPRVLELRENHGIPGLKTTFRTSLGPSRVNCWESASYVRFRNCEIAGDAGTQAGGLSLSE